MSDITKSIIKWLVAFPFVLLFSIGLTIFGLFFSVVLIPIIYPLTIIINFWEDWDCLDFEVANSFTFWWVDMLKMIWKIDR